MSKTIVAIFDNYENAEKAAKEIKDNGLRTSDISIITKEKNNNPKDSQFKSESSSEGNFGMSSQSGTSGGIGTKAANDNISDGVISGGILGGLAGLLVGAGTMIIPGLGIIAAAGPIAGLISGAVTGGIVGGLIDLGIPENESKKYEQDIKEGKVLFSMKTDDDKLSDISSILKNNSANNITNY